jgi:hypothetical protein
MKWIIIKDRLPEHEQIVDIFHKSGGRFPDCMFVDPSKYDDPDDLHFYDTYRDRIYGLDFVTHWMPRPEPPKED